MFDETNKYKKNGHFFLKPSGNMESSCNAPKNSNGVFIVYELVRGRINLVYIGSSCKIQKNGLPKKSDNLYDEIVNVNTSLVKKMKADNADALDIYWYETFNEKLRDIPSYVEGLLMQRFFEINGCLPDLNKEL